jgi:hypothetical protein
MIDAIDVGFDGGVLGGCSFSLTTFISAGVFSKLVSYLSFINSRSSDIDIISVYRSNRLDVSP